MTRLITGATGFIGRNLTNALVRRGERVVAVSRRPQSDAPCDLITWRLSPQDADGWTGLLDDVTTVYHLAWSSLPKTSNEDPLLDASDNILNSIRLLEAAKKKENLRVVFASSGGTVYGVLNKIPAAESHDTHPKCAYGVSKLAVEKYLGFYQDFFGLDCVALRIGNPYGPLQDVGRNFGAVSTFSARAARGEPITVYGDGSIVRDYLYIDDLVEALIIAGEQRGGPIVMNLGSGLGKSLNDIIGVLDTLRKKKSEVRYVEARAIDVPVSVLDSSLAQAVLGWRPKTSFEAGVELTLKALADVR